MKNPCLPGRRVLARGPVCSVEECSCGVLHVTLGVLTVRLDLAVVDSLYETLGAALRTLAEHGHDVDRAEGRWVS